jgi:hypothetical protein
MSNNPDIFLAKHELVKTGIGRLRLFNFFHFGGRNLLSDRNVKFFELGWNFLNLLFGDDLNIAPNLVAKLRAIACQHSKESVVPADFFWCSHCHFPSVI